MAGQDHKTRDVISFCKGRLRPKRRVDLPGALSAPSPQGQGSRGAARRRVIPTPTPLHTRPLVCTLHSPVYTSVHPLSSRLPLHITRAHTHAHTGLPPPHNTIAHPTLLAHTSSALPRAPLANAKVAPHERYTRGGRQLGWSPQGPGPSLHVNEFIS